MFQRQPGRDVFFFIAPHKKCCEVYFAQTLWIKSYIIMYVETTTQKGYEVFVLEKLVFIKKLDILFSNLYL